MLSMKLSDFQHKSLFASAQDEDSVIKKSVIGTDHHVSFYNVFLFKVLLHAKVVKCHQYYVLLSV